MVKQNKICIGLLTLALVGVGFDFYDCEGYENNLKVVEDVLLESELKLFVWQTLLH